MADMSRNDEIARLLKSDLGADDFDLKEGLRRLRRGAGRTEPSDTPPETTEGPTMTEDR